MLRPVGKHKIQTRQNIHHEIWLIEYRHFFQERYTDDQQVYGKVFNISNYQKNANQNLKEVSPHTG